MKLTNLPTLQTIESFKNRILERKHYENKQIDRCWCNGALYGNDSCGFLINAIPVAAEEVTPATTGTISVQQGDTHTYSVYQIFTGDLTKDGKLSNIKWGSNGKTELPL